MAERSKLQFWSGLYSILKMSFLISASILLHSVKYILIHVCAGAYECHKGVSTTVLRLTSCVVELHTATLLRNQQGAHVACSKKAVENL